MTTGKLAIVRKKNALDKNDTYDFVFPSLVKILLGWVELTR